MRGAIWPEAKFAIKLPTEWNDRFQMVGNGGTAGTISMGAVDGAVRKGFASASTDTGHDAAKEPLATFAWVTPENPHGKRKLTDFAYLSVHETTVLAKRMIQAYYGKAPRYSYWVGCSTGGRQGMQEAQRYPEDFDGLVIGAPGLYLTGNVTRRMWVGQSQVGAGLIAPDKLPALGQAVTAKCDEVDGLKDGLKDGLIDDPRRCKFDPSRDLTKCEAGADTPQCFTAAQIEALVKIYGGPRTSKGKQVFPGEPLSGELGWAENLVGPSKVVLPRSESQMKLAMLDPAPGPSWKLHDVQFRHRSGARQQGGGGVESAESQLGSVEETRRQDRPVFRLGRSAGESVSRHRILRDGEQAHGRNADARLLPVVHGAGYVPLQRWSRLRVGGLAGGCYGLGGEGLGAGAVSWRACRARQDDADANALSLSAGGALQGYGEHRRSGELQLCRPGEMMPSTLEPHQTGA